MFVRAFNGQAYPVAEVETIWREDGPNNTIDGYATVKGVGKVRLWYGEYERIFAGDLSYVAAQPGWKTIERFEDDQGYELLANDVLAWAIDADGGILPVTLEGFNCGDSQWEAFETPTGKIVDKTGLNELDRKDFYKSKRDD